MRYFPILLLFLATTASAFDPEHCLLEDDCSGTVASPLPAQNALFSTFWEIGPQPPAHCGNKIFINYDPSVIAWWSATTNAQTGQDQLTYEISPAFAGGTCSDCTEGLVLTWFDLFNDATLLPAGPDTELEITWQYLSATAEPVWFDGIVGDGLEFLPSCTITETDTVNDLFVVPEPAMSLMLAGGILFLASVTRRPR